MKKLESLSDGQFIDHLTYVGRLYRIRFHKDLGITREVGEYKASKLLRLKRAEGNINKGYDAIDKDGKRVQIKSRVITSSKGRTGRFNNWDFDYALLVLLSDNYKVQNVYKAGPVKIKGKWESTGYKHPSLSINEFISIAEPVYPRT